MDSQPLYDGILLDVIDNEWRQDELPFDQILVPAEKLSDSEADNDSHLTLKEQEEKWSDLNLTSLAPDLAAISDQINAGV